MRWTTFLHAAACALCAAALADAARADDAALTLAQRFEATARADGPSHAAGLDALLAEGEALLPLCDERTGSDDVRERQLARYLRLAVREPAKVAAWSAVLERPADWTNALQVVAKPPSDARFVRRETEVLTVGAESACFFDEMLRRGDRDGWDLSLAVAALAAVGDADAAPTLVRSLDDGGGEIAVAGLRRLGAPALPVLRGFLDGDARCGAASGRGLDHLRTTAVAAFLAEAGDREAIASLRRAFVRPGEAAVSAIATALGRLRAEAAAPELVAWYVTAVPGRTSDARRSDGIQAVRAALREIGPAALRAAREHARAAPSMAATVLADALAFEVEHAKESDAWFAEVGRLLGATDDERRGGPLPRSSQSPVTTQSAATARLEFEGGRAIPPGAPPAPAPLLAERALVHASADDAIRLLDIAPDAGAAVAVALATSRDPRHAGALVLALAERRRPEAVTVATARLDAGACWEADDVVEAMLTIDGAGADAVLARIASLAADAKRRDREQLAKAAALVAAFGAAPRDFGTLLASGAEPVRRMAACVLARRGDPSGVETLLRDAMTPPPHELMERGTARSLILRLGAAALPALDAIAKRDDVRAARAAAGLAFRIREPERAARFDAALRQAGLVYRMHVVHEDQVAAAGQMLAARNADALPLVDDAAILLGDAICGYAARFARGEMSAVRDEEPPPPPAWEGDVDRSIAAVAAGEADSASAASRLAWKLGAAPAAEQILVRLRAAPDDRARWNALRLVSSIVWGYPGREHDKDGSLVPARAESLAALLALVGSDDPVAAREAAELVVTAWVGADSAQVTERFVAWMEKDAACPDGTLMWLARNGVAAASERLLARYSAQHMGDPRLAEFLGEIRWAPASAALWKSADAWIRQRPAYWDRIAELDALARIGGAEDLDRLAAVYRSAAPVKVRMQAAEGLASAGDTRLLDELLKEFGGLVAAEAARGVPDGTDAPRGERLFAVHRPALALLRMDPGRGARAVYDALLGTTDARVRDALVAAIATHRREHPGFTPPATPK